MSFGELRKEIMLLLRWHAGTLRLPMVRSEEHTYLLAVLDLVDDLKATLQAYIAERSIRQDVEALESRHEAQVQQMLADEERVVRTFQAALKHEKPLEQRLREEVEV
ncbi:MAG: hypothetical protein KatS3mg023_3461 [Armatimonadota bacterium]|nr:MAG: hypothetical protein KatS3mg023_3461 [Armatimonadota bacterium]